MFLRLASKLARHRQRLLLRRVIRLAGVLAAKIAFESEVSSEIYTMNAEGTNQTNRSNNPAIDFKPDWSPDGQKIALPAPSEALEQAISCA